MKKRTLLKELEAEGRTIMGQTDLSQYITDFYAKLYASEEHVPGTSKVWERCWENIPIQVTEAMNTTMTKDPTLQEILEAITTLPKGKAPGHDAIPTEFF